MLFAPPDSEILSRRAAIVAALKAIVPDGVVETPTDLSAYESDALASYRQRPLVAVLPKTGEQVKVVGIGSYNVAVSLQRRNAVKLGAPVNAISHSKITEIYYITSGSGTMVVDGALANVKAMDPAGDVVAIAAGPSTQSVMTGGLSRNVSAGDVIVVPPNTPHGWSQIDDQVSYVMFRTDPDKVLPAGWVNPNLK